MNYFGESIICVQLSSLRDLPLASRGNPSAFSVIALTNHRFAQSNPNLFVILSVAKYPNHAKLNYEQIND